MKSLFILAGIVVIILVRLLSKFLYSDSPLKRHKEIIRWTKFFGISMFFTVILYTEVKSYITFSFVLDKKITQYIFLLFLFIMIIQFLVPTGFISQIKQALWKKKHPRTNQRYKSSQMVSLEIREKRFEAMISYLSIGILLFAAGVILTYDFISLLNIELLSSENIYIFSMLFEGAFVGVTITTAISLRETLYFLWRNSESPIEDEPLKITENKKYRTKILRKLKRSVKKL